MLLYHLSNHLSIDFSCITLFTHHFNTNKVHGSYVWPRPLENLGVDLDPTTDEYTESSDSDSDSSEQVNNDEGDQVTVIDPYQAYLSKLVCLYSSGEKLYPVTVKDVLQFFSQKEDEKDWTLIMPMLKVSLKLSLVVEIWGFRRLYCKS